MQKKTCKSCGQTMTVSNFYKSKNIKDGYENKCKKCRNRQRDKTHKHICQQCGKEFTSREKDQRYCDLKCHGMARRKRIKTKCTYCGQGIDIIESKYKRFNKFYCNQDCRTSHLQVLVNGENNPNYKRVKYKCDGCGMKIMVVPHKLKNQKYIFCSNECYKANIGQYFMGEDNNFWNFELTDEERLDLRRYPEYYEWREKIFLKDNYTCQCCGDSAGGNLNAHHIFNYSEHPELRLDIDNGITLCEKCHKLFHNTYGYVKNNNEQLNKFLNEYDKRKAL